MKFNECKMWLLMTVPRLNVRLYGKSIIFMSQQAKMVAC